MFSVKSMKMRWAVIAPEHLDYDTIKNANRRHMRLLSWVHVGEQRDQASAPKTPRFVPAVQAHDHRNRPQDGGVQIDPKFCH